MAVANLAVLVKMSGGLLPPNSRAGDVEIYDNGRMLIFESDTDIVERQIDRQKVLEILQYSRETGFFQLPNIIHDSGSSPNVPDITLSIVDAMGNNTVTMTSYQRLKGEMRKSPFDLIYKKITDMAWESYTNGNASAGAPAAAQQAPQAPTMAAPVPPQAPAPTPQRQMPPQSPPVQSQVPPLPFSAQSENAQQGAGFDLPSLDDLLKSSGLQFDAPTSNVPAQSQGLPPLTKQPAMQQTNQSGPAKLPPLSQPAPNATTGGMPQIPPLDAVFKQNPQRQQPSPQPKPQPAPPKQPQTPVQQQPVANTPPQQAQPKQQKPAQSPQQAQPQQPKKEREQPPQQAAPAPKQPSVQQAPKPAPVVVEPEENEEPPRAPERPPKAPEPRPRPPEPQRQDVPPSRPAPEPLRSREEQARPPREEQPRQRMEESRPPEKEQRPPMPPREERRPPAPTPVPRQQPAVSVAPQRKPPVAWERTQESIERLEQSLHAKVLVFYAANSHLNMEDMRYLYSHLRKLGRKKSLYVIPFIQETDSTVIWRMATLMREFCEELTVILPEESTMATTMFALAADSILMNPFGFLSPIDTSFSHTMLQSSPSEAERSIPISEIFQASAMPLSKPTTKQKEELPQPESSSNPFHPLITAAASRQFALTQRICTNLLKLSAKNKRTDAEITRIVTQLTTGYPSVNYPIVYFEAQTLGLPVGETNEAVNDVLWDLVKEYVYITQPVLHFQGDHKTSEKQNIIIESTGRRTIHYSEELTAGTDEKMIEAHSRWRELTQQISINQAGKESNQLIWKELQLIGSNEN